jgi:UDP-glucose:(heptosyl)LPS alpha-1,3-glucosyltransferase
LSAVSRLVAGQLARFFGRNDVFVISNAVDAEQFNPGEREARRASARIELGIGKNDFVLLLIGKDWKKKGLTCLLRSLTQLDITRVRLLVVGTDVVSPYESILQEHHLHEKVFFFPPRADVQYYYAAADAYVGPSLEDAFALPPAEAMACGLPVIVSSEAGVSEWVTQNSNGLILENPHDAEELKRLICSLVADASFCKRLGEKGAITARQYSWERNAVAAKSFLEEAIRRKAGTTAPRDARESDEI